ncbi:long-chain-fatty-acid--CoA ligase [Streptomyces megasporus]|uniref:long-chain-fatty-acid--CoA ligase n=1 Tax=Streptomyces megasporus TaxID=44060 RepID=UPI00068DCAC2|nr:long-chain-fatty-acid--CoA ligase [Streptomyces megasporus]
MTAQGGIGLSVATLLRRAASVAPGKEIREADPAGRPVGTPWAVLRQRALRLTNALARLGIEPGGAVATFAWNSTRHLEWFFGVPMASHVLVPVNVRFSDEQIAWVVAHANARVMVVDASLTGRLARLLPRLRSVREFVVMPDGGEVHPAFAGAHHYEELLASAEPDEPRDVAENRTACLCYTGGTTGNPKGVAHSHRSIVLHSLAVCAADAFAIRERDVILPLTPLFHAAAWGLPYAAAMAGAGLVFTGPHLKPEAIAATLRRERVTFSAGVPTFWLALDELDPPEEVFASLERIVCGGSAIPYGLVRRYADRGVTMQQGLGMTENMALVALTTVRGSQESLPPEKQLELHDTQGLAVPGVELRLVGERDEVLPHDGVTQGELEVRSFWGATRYENPGDDTNTRKFHDGWLRSGDIASIDPDGYVRITDRSKDLIKSGGEWISSITVESALMDHPDVLEAAVVAMPDARWQERPLAVVVARPGAGVAPEALRAFLNGRLPKWWLPDRYVFVSEIPRTATNKFDKKVLRSRYAGH